MRVVLVDASVVFDAVDYVNVYGTLILYGDFEEACVIAKVFGAHVLDKKFWVSSMKSVMGHLFGGVGGVEVVLSVLVIVEEIVLFIANFDDFDPEAPPNRCPITDFIELTQNFLSST
jgi:3-oxoacyl-(acyl-carrier-protein) synthase